MQFGPSPSAAQSNEIVDDAMNILYPERMCGEMGGKKKNSPVNREVGGVRRTDQQQKSGGVVLFVEGEGGRVPRDIYWKQQRSSAIAMAQAFSNRKDMSMHGRSCDPHTDRDARELRSCRLSEDVSLWEREVGKMNSAPRVQGGLEQVLIKRAYRRREQKERLSQYY